MEKSEAILLKSGARRGCALSALLLTLYPSIGRSCAAIEENEKNGDKERDEISLLTDDMTLYVREPQPSIRKVLEIINKFSNISE